MEIPECFKSEDIIYHYTKLSTAIECILFEEELLLSPRENSYDPIEKVKPIVFESCSEYIGTLDANEIDSIRKYVEGKVDVAKQISFCKNDSENFDIERTPHLPIDYYGFMKPRMWDQYGDKYNGICLAFSISKLKSLTNFHNDNVNYLGYTDLEQNYLSIDYKSIINLGKDEYIKSFEKEINRIMFEKHIDYRDECEYRFMSFSEETKIRFKNSIVGVILNADIHVSYEEIIKKYVEEKNIEMLYVNWRNNSVSINTKEEKEELMNSLNFNQA